MRAGFVEAVVRELEARGVRHAFGLPGTQNVDLFEALRQSRIRVVQATSELTASFMAVGYGRASGKPGVLVTIPGPGFTYALPGLAEARLDSVPLIHVVVQHASHQGKLFRHQEIPHHAMVGALAKAVIQVDLDESGTGSKTLEAVTAAWETAVSGEPGPVVLWLGELDPWPGVSAKGSGSGAGAVPHGAAPLEDQESKRIVGPVQGLPLLLERLKEARRPVLFLGQGAQGDPGAAKTLAERLPAPVFTTPSARGLLPEDHPLSLAFDFDAGGLPVLNELLASSDLVLVLGCKLGHNGTGGFVLQLPAHRTVQVNTDPAALGSNYPASLLIQSDVPSVMAELLKAGAGLVAPGGGEEGSSTPGWDPEEVARWRHRIAEVEPGGPSEPQVHGSEPSTVKEVMALLRQELPRDAILVTDSGLHQVMVRRHFSVLAPRGLLTPTDFQSMGFGLPAAIGAALACPDRKVVAIMGDGGLAMCGMELVTLAREDLPVTVIVFNDGHLNLIRLQQERDYGHAHATRVVGPDLDLMAEAAGVGFLSLDGDVPGGLRAALASRGPVLVDLPLGDSPRIRTARRRAALKTGIRDLVGDGWVERLKRLLGR